MRYERRDDRDYSDRYNLPGLRMIRVVRFCAGCGDRFLVKVRRGGHAPFEIRCPCGVTTWVDLHR